MANNTSLFLFQKLFFVFSWIFGRKNVQIHTNMRLKVSFSVSKLFYPYIECIKGCIIVILYIQRMAKKSIWIFIYFLLVLIWIEITVLWWLF